MTHFIMKIESVEIGKKFIADETTMCQIFGMFYDVVKETKDSLELRGTEEAGDLDTAQFM